MAMSATEKSLSQVNGSLRIMKPISSTSTVDAPDDKRGCDLQPTRIGRQREQVCGGRSHPYDDDEIQLLDVRTMGAPVAFITIVTVRFTRNATPVTMVAPNAG